MTDTRAIFSQNLSRLLEEKGIEQQTVAMDLKVSTSIVSAWVLGKRFPRADMMQELAKYFKVTVSDLVDLPTDHNGNGEVMALRERLRRQPGARMLLDATKDATADEIRQYVDVIKALRKTQHDDE